MLDKTISNDIRTILLVYLAKECSPDRIDWSGLGLDNIAPQFLASMASMEKETAAPTELTTRFCVFVNSRFKQGQGWHAPPGIFRSNLISIDKKIIMLNCQPCLGCKPVLSI